MKTVGLTGGIGSGKSMVAQLLNVLNIPVYNSDSRAKYLMNNDKQLICKIKDLLGEMAYENGKLNRPFVSQKVFNDKSLLSQLNQLVHPAVKADFKVWCSNFKNAKVVVQEAAILFENGNYSEFDHMVLVKAPLEDRIYRVIKRDGVNREKVFERINNQWDDEKKERLSNTIILNDNQHSLIEQVLKFLNNL